MGEGMSEIRSAPEALQVDPRNTDSTERLIDVTSGTKCFSDWMAQNLLGNALSRLKFEHINFLKSALQEQSMAFQTGANKEN
jgi:hypothetical protein